MIRSIVFFAALASLAAATVARAADEGASPDVRCLAVAATMAQSSDPKTQGVSLAAALYYLGKLDGRDPNFDLEGQLKQELAQLKPQDMIAEVQRCGAQLNARQKTVTEIAARLQAQGIGKAPAP
jgi:hypothetical protein